MIALHEIIATFSLILGTANTVPSNGHVIHFVASDFETEISMCEDFINDSDLRKFEISIAETVSNSNSLEELESWLQSRRYIDFVRLEDYVIKTFPPRREFTIGLKMKGGTIREKVLTIVILEDNQFEFHEMREPS